MKEGCCAICSFWEGGECHKRAPESRPDPAFVINGQPPIHFISCFPPTRSTDWCGDFHHEGGNDGRRGI